MRLLVVGALVTGCGFSAPAGTGSSDDVAPPDTNGGIDAPAIDAPQDAMADAFVADARACFGEGFGGAAQVCLDADPPATRDLGMVTFSTTDGPCTAIKTLFGREVCVIAAHAVTVSGTGTGFIAIGSRPLVVLAIDDVTFNDSAFITVSSHRGGVVGAGATSTDGCGTPTTPESSGGGGGGGAGGSLQGKGGDGGNGNSNGGGTDGGRAAGAVGLGMHVGCPGQKGGNSSGTNGGIGGAGGGAVYIIAGGHIILPPTAGVYAAGAGGTGGPVEAGGGGGGAGGFIGLDAPTLMLGGEVIANGGGGGEGGTNSGGIGENGSDGYAGIEQRTSGGKATGGGGDGGDGSGLGVQTGASGSPDQGGAGGGGGGAGFIYRHGMLMGTPAVFPPFSS